MALLFCDGFGHIEDGFDDLKYNFSESANYIIYENDIGSLGGYGIRMSSVTAAKFKKYFSNKSTIVAGFRGKFDEQKDGWAIFTIEDTDTIQVEVRFVSGGRIQVITGGVDYFTPVGSLEAATWRYIEIKVLFSQTVGTLEVKIDGVSLITETSIDTCATANEYCNMVSLRSNIKNCYYDDFYICDTTGSLNNDFLGDIKVETLWPTSDGNSSDFTPSSGSDHYALVDDPQLSADADHNESSTVGHKDSYGMTTLSGSSTVLGVQISAAVKNTDTGTMVVKPFCRSGATPADNEGDSYTLSQTWKAALTVFEQEPTDVVAWTQAKINSAEFGIKVES